jgi:adenylate kinase family enzyme
VTLSTTSGMRKVLVIGPGGAGKSTLARRIGERTGLPVIHLDAHYWKPGWVPTAKEEWLRLVTELCTRDAWVMDGNYGGTLDVRMRAADTIVFLDVPVRVSLWGIVERRLRHRGRHRADMAEGCDEQLTWQFLWWVYTYRRRKRPGILRTLAALSSEKRVIVLTSRRDAERFASGLGVPSPSR